MIPFLKSVAQELLAGDFPLSEMCIVTPGKRGGTFLRKYFAECLSESDDPIRRSVVMLPEIMTISDFVCDISGLEVDSRLDQLFTLYIEYRSLCGDDTIDFDRFRAWGEVVIADFNDVDMYDVDAEKLFVNLSDFREIKTDYITSEQREIIREYFGEDKPEKHLERFWQHLLKGERISRRFMSLWELLPDLYRKFNDALESRGLCYSGASYKRACEVIERRGVSALRWNKIVFVGFNALSTIERKLFALIQKIRVKTKDNIEESMTDFFWDYNGMPLDAEKGVGSAGRFLHKNVERFPSSCDMDKYRTSDSFPDVLKVISCPGNSVQAKVTTGILEDIINRVTPETVNAAKVAVVLPDENLLFPLIYSLPRNIESVNLTMGYPLKLTSAASFISLVRKMFLRRRKRDNVLRYYREDVELLLSHPITLLLIGNSDAEKIKEKIASHKMFDVSVADIRKFCGKNVQKLNFVIDVIFDSLPAEADSEDVCTVFLNIIEICVESLKEGLRQDIPISNDLEITNFNTYKEAIVRFRETARAHNISMKWKTAVTLIDRLLASEKVALQGEPLRGVQIMGMLETRSLDFDYIIIPSMNERIFPRKFKTKTFIPNALRCGYGMATTKFQESIYAYYFYRLISRAKEVYMLYDARQGGLQSGDVSRYVLQLKYLYPQSHLQWESRRFMVSTSVPDTIIVDKTPEIMQELDQYCISGSKHNISASALKNYIACPLKFYFSNVKRINVDDTPTEFMDAATQGTIFHDVMQKLYDSAQRSKGADGSEINSDIITEWLNRPSEYPDSIKSLVTDEMSANFALNKKGDYFNGGEQLFAEVIEKYIRWTLQFDRIQTPFVYVGGEIERIIRYPLDETRAVNVKFIIDRVDRINENGDSVLRIIDYKTGKDELQFASVSDLFKGKNNAVFQLMMYASMYPLCEDGPADDEKIKLGIYKIRALGCECADWEVNLKGLPLDSHLPYKQEFLEYFDELIKEIFNPEIPFKAKPSRSCQYCDMRSICHK